MVAVMADPDEVDEQPGLSWKQVDDLCRYWGEKRWRVGLAGGFPEESAIVGHIEIYEPREWFQVKQITANGRQRRNTGGHRVLYDQAWYISPLLIAVNMAVCALPEPQFRAIVVAYALGYVVPGKEISHKERAEMLGITVDALSERLRRARKNLSRALAKATGYRYVSS